jgi:diguanylate cyclase (GGDEF)-like protein
MLQCVAKALSTELKRATDLLYRYGGEEFSALLPNTDLAGAIIVAEHMRKSVERTEVFCFSTNSATKATVSIGVATARPKVTDSLCDFIERADHMLYKAKNSGRNRVQFE